MSYKVVSLFSGCGGMDIGAEGGFRFFGKKYEKLDFEIVQAIEIDEKIANLYNLNNKIECEIKDIQTVPENNIKEHDILMGGFPCQSFSIVAQNPKRLGYKDERGKLFFEICRVLKQKQPRIFVAENVKGIMSANNGEAFELIIKEFEKSGYYIKYQLLNSVDYGVPQKRERVFIIGFRNIEDYHNFNFPNPAIFPKKIVIKDILEPEYEVDAKHYFSDRAVAGLMRNKKHNPMNKGRIQDINGACNTVGAHLAKVSLNGTDPVLKINGRYRMFTPREVSRIQSFPDSFVLLESRITNYKALGNAVPPVLMWHVARELEKTLKINESVQNYLCEVAVA